MQHSLLSSLNLVKMDKLFIQDFSKPPDLKTGTNIPQTLFNRSTGNSKNVPKELQYMAEEALIMKSHKEFPCKLPDVPRSTFLMVFSPDGTKVASTHGNHNVYVTELTSKRNVRTLSGHPRTPWCIAFHPSSNQILASGCLGGQVRVWDLHGGSEIWMTESQTVIASLAFHPTDRLLVIASYNEVLFWDWSCPAPFAKSTTINEKEKVRFVGFDPLGHKLLTGVANAPLRIESQWNRTPLPPAPSQPPPPAPPAEEPFQNDYERRIIVCYRFMVQQYEQLVHRYRLLIRARSGSSSSIAGSSSSVLGGGDAPPLRRRTPPTPGSGARTIRRFRSNHPLPTRLTQFQLARLRPAVLRLSERRVPGSLFSSRVNRGVVTNPVAAGGSRDPRGGDEADGSMLHQFESEITESLARLHRNIRRMRIHMPWESEHRDARASSAMNTPLNAMYNTSDSDIDIESFGPTQAGGGGSSPPSPHSARITVVPNPSGAHSWRQRDPFSYTPGRNTSSLGERIRNRSHQSELRRLYLRANRFPVFGPPRNSGRPHRNPGGTLNRAPGTLNHAPGGTLNRAPGTLNRSPGSLNHNPGGTLNRAPGTLNRAPGTLNRSPGTPSRLPPGTLTRTIDNNRTPPEEQAAPTPPTDYESLQSLLSELNSDAARGYWATRRNGEVMGYQPPSQDEVSSANRSSGLSAASLAEVAASSGPRRSSAEVSTTETGDAVTLESMLANVGSASSTGNTGSLTLSESEVTLNPVLNQSEDAQSSRSAVVSVMGVAARPYTSYPASRLVDLADYLATTEDVLEPTGPFLRATTYSIRQFFGNMQATYNVIASGGVTSLSIERLDFLHEHYASNRSFQSIVQLARHLYHASIMCRARFLVVKAAALDRRWAGILAQLSRYSAFAVTPANTSRAEATAEFFSDLDRNGRLLEVCFGALAQGSGQEYDRNIFDAASEVRGYEDAARRLQRVLLRHLRWTSRRLDVWGASPQLPHLGDVAELDSVLRRELLALDVMSPELTQASVRAVRDQFVDTLIQDLSPPIFEDTLITCIRRFSSLSSRMDDIITSELSSLPAMPPDPAAMPPDPSAMPGPSRAGASAAMFSEDESSASEADVNPYDDLGDGATMADVLHTVSARPGFEGVDPLLDNNRPGFDGLDPLPLLDNVNNRPDFEGVDPLLDNENTRPGFEGVDPLVDSVNTRPDFEVVDPLLDNENTRPGFEGVDPLLDSVNPRPGFDGLDPLPLLDNGNNRAGFDGLDPLPLLDNVNNRAGFDGVDPLLDTVNPRPDFEGVDPLLDNENTRPGFEGVDPLLDSVNPRPGFDGVDTVEYEARGSLGTSRTNRSIGHDIRGNRSVGDDHQVHIPIGDNRSNRLIEGDVERIGSVEDTSGAGVRDIYNMSTGEESADISYMEEILARSNRITRDVSRDMESTSSTGQNVSTRFNRTGDDAAASNAGSHGRNASARNSRTDGDSRAGSSRMGTSRSSRLADDNRSGSTRNKRTFGEASGNGATDRADNRSGARRPSDENRHGARSTRSDSANPAHRKLLRRSRQQRLRPAYRVASSSSSEDEAPVIEISDTDSDRPSASSTSDLLRRLKALAHTNGSEATPTRAPPPDPHAPSTSTAPPPLSSESSLSDTDSDPPGHSSTSDLLRRLKALARTTSSESTPNRRPVDPNAPSTSTAQTPLSSESSSFSNIMQSVREFITQLETLVGPGRNVASPGRHAPATGRSSAATGRTGRTRASDIFDIFPSSSASSSSTPSSTSTSSLNTSAASTPEAPRIPSAPPSSSQSSLLRSPLSAFMSGIRRKRKLPPLSSSEATEPPAPPRRRRRHVETEPSQREHDETFSSTQPDECSCWFRAAVDSSTPTAGGSHQSPGTGQSATACPLDKTQPTASCDSSTAQSKPGCSSSNQPKPGCSYSSSSQSKPGVDSSSNQSNPGGRGEPNLNRYSSQSSPDSKQSAMSGGQSSNATSVAHVATCSNQAAQSPNPSSSSQASSSSTIPPPLPPPVSATQPLDQDVTSSNPADQRTSPPAAVSEGIFTRFLTRFERLLESDRAPALRDEPTAESPREGPQQSENASAEEPPFGHAFPPFPSATTPTPPEAQARRTQATPALPPAPRSVSQAPPTSSQAPPTWESVRFLRVPRARPWESCSFSSPNSRVPSPSRIVDVEMLRVPSLSPWELPLRPSSHGGRDFASSAARASRSAERGNNASGAGYGRNIFTEEGASQSQPGGRNNASGSGNPTGPNRSEPNGQSGATSGGGLYLLSRFLSPELAAGGPNGAEGTPTFSYLGRSRDRSRTRERDRDRSRSREDHSRHRFDRSPEDTEISRTGTPVVPATPSELVGPARATPSSARRESESVSRAQLRTMIKSHRMGGGGTTPSQGATSGTRRFDTPQRVDSTHRPDGPSRSGTHQRNDPTRRADGTTRLTLRTDSRNASNERSDANRGSANQREDTPQRTVQRLLHNPRVRSTDMQWPHERDVRFPSPDLNLSVSIAEASRLIDHSLVCLRNSAAPRDPSSSSAHRPDTSRHHGFLTRSSPLSRPLARSSPLSRPIPARANSSPLNLARASPLNRPLSRCSPLNRPIPRSSPLNRPHSSSLNRPNRTSLLSRIHASGSFMSRAALGRAHSPSRTTDLLDAGRDVGRSTYLMNQRRRMLIERRNAMLRGNAAPSTGNDASSVAEGNDATEENADTPQDGSASSSTRQGPFTPRDDAAESGTHQGAFTAQSRSDRARQSAADSRTRARLVSLANLAKSRNSRRLYAMLRPEMGASSSAAPTPERPPPPPPPASTLPSTSRSSRASRRRPANTSSSDPERNRMMKARSQARHILAMMLRHISSFFQNANLLDLPSQQDQQESFFFHERVYNLHRLLQLALHLTELLYAQLSLSRHLLDNLRSSLNSVTRLQSLLRHRQASSSLLHFPAFRPSRGPIRLTRESSVPITVQSSRHSAGDAPGSGRGGDLPQVHLNDHPLSSPPTLPPLPPSSPPTPSSPPSLRGARFLHPRHHGGASQPGPWDEGEERGGAAPGGGLGSNVFLMRGAYGPNSILVPDSYYSPHHRIQAWDFARSNIPDIWNAQKNIVVKECKIHNDASVDISKDGQILVTLLPSGRLSVTTMLGVYSLHWASLGQCLYTTSFELNAVSVSLSPTSRHLIVGLASRRVSLSSFADTHTIAQIFRLEGGVAGPPGTGSSREGAESGAGGKEPPPGGRKGRLVQLRHIELPRDTGYMSLNCIRWAPTPGQGLVYGTNTGLLRILE